jgi:death-on-curing protein
LPSGRRHYRITLRDVLAAHDEALTYGGRPGVLTLGLVESAIARPYATFGGRPLYRRMSQKAAALLESLAKNHGFVDGNKRTALLAVYLLLRRSGCDLSAGTTNEDFENVVLAATESRMAFEDLAAWFERRIVRVR